MHVRLLGEMFSRDNARGFSGKPGSRIEDRGSRIEDRGLRIEDRRLRIKDRVKKKTKTIISHKFVTGLHDSRCCYCLGSFILQDLFQVSKYLLSRGKLQNFP